MPTTVTHPKPRKAKSAADVRAGGYRRNMEYVQDFKASHPCKNCGRKYPARVMEFSAPAPGEWSVSRLAGSRCNLEVLTAAMLKARLLCANCKRMLETKE